ncbi:MAG: type II toxin-antitoxin system RelE/ParE family toxin [Burkholderiaceae bacterium]|nr:type II toxin-antitoxin system RelE/ParE family toxin [Burkholderiaceae bacterium]
MKTYLVNFSPESIEQLVSLYHHLAAEAGPVISNNYVNAVVDYCESLKTFPLRGVARDDIREGLRIAHYKGRTIIAYAVFESTISIIGVFYGGQDYESKLGQ